jgi:hypothetical protein
LVAVGVPVQQVEGFGLLALEVVADHVLPDEVVGPQAGEDLRELTAHQQAALADGGFAGGDGGFVDQTADFAGIGKIKQRGHQGEARHRVFAAARDGRGRQDGAADAEAEDVGLVHLGDFTHHLEAAWGLARVVVPAEVAASSASAFFQDTRKTVKPCSTAKRTK